MLHLLPRLAGLGLPGILLASASAGAYAQAIYTLPPPTATGYLPGSRYVVRQVVDARPRPARLGSVLRGGDTYYPAEYGQPLAATLQNFFEQYTPSQLDSQPLALRLRVLRLAEQPAATASLVADVYAPRPDGTYRRLAHVATHATMPTTFLVNPTSQHAANVGKLLLEMAQLVRDPARWLPDTASYPAAYVLATAPHPAEQLPLLAAARPPRAGIYYTLPELWYDAPAEPGRPIITQQPYHSLEWAGDSLVQLHRRLPDGQLRPVTNALAFSDGQRLYWHHGREYHPLVRRGAGFIFYGMVGDDPVYLALANRQTNRQALLMGAASALATSPSLTKRTLFSLDPLTGVANLDGGALTQPGTARPTQLYVYRPRGKGPAVRVGVAGGEAPRELLPGDYLTFTLPGGQPMQLCAYRDGQPDYCLPLTPLEEGATYLECAPATKGAPLQAVPTRTGAAALERLVR